MFFVTIDDDVFFFVFNALTVLVEKVEMELFFWSFENIVPNSVLNRPTVLVGVEMELFLRTVKNNVLVFAMNSPSVLLENILLDCVPNGSSVLVDKGKRELFL